jgi:hypothetical protein
MFLTLIIGLVSVAIYFFVIRPLLPTRPRDAAQANRQPRPVQAQPKQVERCQRVPSHVSAHSARIAVRGGANLLSDGVVAFRHSKASCYEQSACDNETVLANRKERARVLSRLLEGERTATSGGSSAATAPPSKGSVVVVSVPEDDVDCAKLRRVIYLLGTHYNLFVILAVHSSESSREDRKKLIQRLRGETSSSLLPVDVIPDHRIVAASTVTGRIAFCRQLQKTELVLDYDSEVKSMLGRFGHRVIVYGKNYENNQCSKLGSALL